MVQFWMSKTSMGTTQQHRQREYETYILDTLTHPKVHWIGKHGQQWNDSTYLTNSGMLCCSEHHTCTFGPFSGVQASVAVVCMQVAELELVQLQQAYCTQLSSPWLVRDAFQLPHSAHPQLH